MGYGLVPKLSAVLKRLELYLHLIFAGIEELAEKCPIHNRKVILRHIRNQPSEYVESKFSNTLKQPAGSRSK